ncbi:hypothetical protein CRUP_036824 [Coryphaenoides rupestris]|nr:hypothetical protein CRUP_036824 [Coryphaenoides rupestris]
MSMIKTAGLSNEGYPSLQRHAPDWSVPAKLLPAVSNLTLCVGQQNKRPLPTDAAMQLEIQVALNFIISYLYNKLPRRRVNIFGEELDRQLKKKYEGHWYPDKPFKGSGFRCIHVGEKVDPVVEQAAKESGLDIEDVRNNLPQDLSVWIDPFEVSYQIGEKGAVKVLYVDDNGSENGSELDKEIKNSFNPEAGSSPSPPFGQSAAKAISTSMHSLYGLGLSQQQQQQQQQKASALSPNAKEFVFPSLQGQASPGGAAGFPGEGSLGQGPLQYSNAFDVFSAYGGLNDKSLMEGLNFSLSNMQYSNQQFQPVMAN